ncbi:hypothetical protein A2875_04885 [Candidatus Gottesmanbacteria bacterium RIFCSPHIGHO2_01_FULL_46_14]|uniref:Uncharacterized protein n=3 Tax=Candidatus Gottesmaniibacteriota TaxID=1752720 RepID=A0A1F5ZQ16_9BACT|nr:MAG: hypothetical protein UY08_C0010G0007 [Candidatus Gottesmanbacteria bacterium GW2011_GWA1_47_8]OGG14197.1 MAG: hypothetical protein A2875_04885 [Candidatus Gottesmanbacteria bacterium RIFCSPHIGHO2_01_FULL_46_14]OGG29442.1 MAG: hypothetical protein A2971_02635 [Candidatus Gottesmanbacteria bacterium RIFCSPLOWO2_01_FULL_46_21]
MTDSVYKKFVQRWEDVMELPPTSLGPLTPLYKTLTRRLKVMPFPSLVIVSLLCVIGVYMLFGSAITLLASLLQRGF